MKLTGMTNIELDLTFQELTIKEWDLGYNLSLEDIKISLSRKEIKKILKTIFEQYPEGSGRSTKKEE